MVIDGKQRTTFWAPVTVAVDVSEIVEKYFRCFPYIFWLWRIVDHKTHGCLTANFSSYLLMHLLLVLTLSWWAITKLMAAVEYVGRKLPVVSVSWSELSWAIPQSWSSTSSKQCLRFSSLLGEGAQLQLYVPLQHYHRCCWRGFLSSTGHGHSKQLNGPKHLWKGHVSVPRFLHF